MSQNLRILTHSRDAMRSQFAGALWVLFAMIVFLSATIHWVSQRRLQAGILSLKEPLEALAQGKPHIELPPKNHPIIGRIGSMIHRTAKLISSQRSQIRSLKHLSNWQETSRRHAHEIRTPLTAARLETERLLSWEKNEQSQEPAAIQKTAENILTQLDQLKQFTNAFTAFGRTPQAKPVPVEPGAMVAEFCQLFANAWSNLKLQYHPPEVNLKIALDKEMIRQVLVNLCSNSSLAMVRPNGTVTFSFLVEESSLLLEVADDGPGIPDDILPRLFEPYATTRPIGEGMGLGLAISRKILLDHGGDLLLGETSEYGTTFRLKFSS